MLQCDVIGNLGADAEIKEFSGKKYVSFSVAHSDYTKDQAGNKVEQTVWVSVLWYGDGGGLFPYLKRGNKVFVRGRQSVKLYADKNGNAQYAINVNATEIQLCGTRSENPAQQGAIPMHQQPQTQQPPQVQTDDLPF